VISGLKRNLLTLTSEDGLYWGEEKGCKAECDNVVVGGKD